MITGLQVDSQLAVFSFPPVRHRGENPMAIRLMPQVCLFFFGVTKLTSRKMGVRSWLPLLFLRPQSVCYSPMSMRFNLNFLDLLDDLYTPQPRYLFLSRKVDSTYVSQYKFAIAIKNSCGIELPARIKVCRVVPILSSRLI